MSFDPVEGVNYIFDRYAFMNQILEDGKQELRISEASSRDDIKKAISTARGMYHPDRQARTGDEMKKKAEEKTKLIADCERVLLTPEMKEFFDAKLAGFRETKPHLISDSGIAIISLGETVFDIASLLSDEIVDTSDFEARAKALLQYDEKKAGQLKSLFDMMPDNAQVKSLYRDAMTSEYIYLGFLEDSAWAKVGYMNRKEKDEGFMIRASDYTKRVDAALEKAAARDIDATIEGHAAVARIGMAKTPLLLDAAEGTMPGELMDPVNAQRLMDKFKDVAHKNFAIRAEYVREVAKRKEAALETLLTLTIIEPVGTEQKDQQDFDFYLANPPDEAGESRVLFRLELDTVSGNAGIGESFGDTILTTAALKTQENLRAGFIITRNAEISDIMVEVGNASEQFLTKKVAEREAAAAAPAGKPAAKGPALRP